MKKKILSISSLLLVFSLLITGYIVYLRSDPLDRALLRTKVRETELQEVAYLENIPIIYIKGSGYEAGLQHGKLLKEQIRSGVEILKHEVLNNYTILGFLTETYIDREAKALDKNIPLIYRDEMKGIADGAGVSYNDILLINTFDDISNLSGCSSLAVHKIEGKSRELIHARNLDYPIKSLAGRSVILHYLDQKFISVAFPGYIGALTATNYNGVSLSVHTSYSSDKDPHGEPMGFIYRRLIENASNLNDAARLLKASKRTIGNNLLVSSNKENSSVVFEISGSSVVSRKGDTHSTATNHFVSPEMPNNASSGSIKRFTELEDAFNKTKNIGLQEILTVFSNYDENTNDWTSVANQGTVQSVVFVPEETALYIGIGTQAPVSLKGYSKYDYTRFIK